MESQDLVSLLDADTALKVSSTLDKSTGKINLIDNSLETCWTSQQGLPQSIQISFGNKAVCPKRLSITFQGGFVGTKCHVQAKCPISPNQRDWQSFTHIYPDDVNRQQNFELPCTEELGKGINALKLEFEESSDFFGRITIYDLKLKGTIVVPDDI